jgi:glucose/arabinose dehydrogenase
MNANRARPEPPDLSQYEENRSRFPLDELAKHAGKHVAFSPDGTRIVASGATEEELEAALQAAGIHFSHVVWSYIDGPDVDGRI